VSPRTHSRRGTVFALLVAACVAVAALAIIAGVRAREASGTADAGAARALPQARAAGRRMVLYRIPDRRGEVAIAPAGHAAGRPTMTALHCDRVYFADGRGICLARGHGFAAGYGAEIFDSSLRVRHVVPIQGIPSRARVSPDGRYGSVTTFVAGHAYAAPGTFSTQTTLIDLARGTKIADLEQFTVFNGGRQVTAVDVNYWGVTFAPGDSDRFYATLATGGKTYLIQGSVSSRQAHVIHENVECPSVSPDGTRIAFKKRNGSQHDPWHLTILDLATMRETPLSEPRSVDDQVEWRDDAHVLYAVGGDVWEANADGSGRPRRYIPGGDSPAVVRW
jgi:WD40 repeat protein